MSYEPLHHKYRPQTFANLVGQEAIATTLTNAIRTERIAPAYLFTGPRGTGKTSSARILAKSLNCLESATPTEYPCGRCEVCRHVAGGSALDVIEIDAASNTGVDNMRELIERAQFAPVQCRYKVYVVDECHMLSPAAFNALLKTLEEPPARIVFVLATTDPQRVLPTIISRCQRFDFRRIPLAPMVSHLEAIASKENIDISSEAVTLVAQVSQGGLRDAESLLDQLSLLSGQITVERVWDLVGAVPEQDLIGLLEAIATSKAEDLLDRCRAILNRGREPLVVLQNLAGFYRDLLIAKTAPSRDDLVALTSQTWKALGEFAQQIDINIILAGQQHLKNSEAQIKNTTQPRLWLEVTLLGLLPSALSTQSSEPMTPRLAATEPRSTIKEVSPPVPPLPQKTAPPTPSPQETSSAAASHATSNGGFSPPQEQEPAVTTNPDPEEPASVGAQPVTKSIADAPSESLEQVWQQVIEHLQPFSAQALLRQQCHLIGFDGSVARVGISSQPLLKLAQGKLANIEAAFAAVYHSPVKVVWQIINTSVSRKTSAPESVPQPSSPAPKPPPQPSAPTPPPPASQEVSIPPEETPVFEKPVSSKPPAPLPVEAARHPAISAIPAPELPISSGEEVEIEIDGGEVAIALSALKQFFEGEIIELDDDTEQSEPKIIEPQPPSVILDTSSNGHWDAALDASLDDEEDLIEPQPSSVILDASFNGHWDAALDASLDDDDEDLPF
ncbi:MAG: DNA polymerase III subunit gamma/tau [Kastovskya adunca ATA6-11-RM4]|nr:DNA polymerase III subunit gamma/tau [Kastovskya adunca ATA6-11-RM4]